MPRLTDFTSYADAQKYYSKAAVWKLFDGTKETFNITKECIDRHANDDSRVAVRIAYSDGRRDHLTYSRLMTRSAQFSHWLADKGIRAGDRVAFMLDPSEAFYISLFGTMRAGAIGVPLFTLFGPDGLRLRVDDCRPRLLIVAPEKAQMAREATDVEVVEADTEFLRSLDRFPASYDSGTRAADTAILQYTSGTTRELPAAVAHSHGSLVVLMAAALYGSGIRPGDAFFCPSSPAWGHGLWHGTLAPLALGVTTGTLSGKFDASNLVSALKEFRVTNLSAAATHYRMMKLAGSLDPSEFVLEKISYTGEPIDSSTLDFVENTFGILACSMYGTTEIGVVLVNYPGADDFEVKRGSLGKPVPGIRLEVRTAQGTPSPCNEVGELFLERRGTWLSTKDLSTVDSDGYFFHAGRADDVIISAGWTMSAAEIENVLMKHDDVREAAVIGVPDSTRGQIVKAFVVAKRATSAEFIKELQDFTRKHLSQHEYPRQIVITDELPKTPAGKINRKILRDREKASPAAPPSELARAAIGA
ncbi:MAG: acyl-CoA synthetase [Rhizomicrobium sp.]